MCSIHNTHNTDTTNTTVSNNTANRTHCESTTNSTDSSSHADTRIVTNNTNNTTTNELRTDKDNDEDSDTVDDTDKGHGTANGNATDDDHVHSHHTDTNDARTALRRSSPGVGPMARGIWTRVLDKSGVHIFGEPCYPDVAQMKTSLGHARIFRWHKVRVPHLEGSRRSNGKWNKQGERGNPCLSPALPLLIWGPFANLVSLEQVFS